MIIVAGGGELFWPAIFIGAVFLIGLVALDKIAEIYDWR